MSPPNASQTRSLYRAVRYTVDPVYNERVGAAKTVHYNRVFTINVFNLTIN
jgi:hypothetical protein